MIFRLLLCSLIGGILFAEPSRPEVENALRKAVEFYWKKVATQGGYHFHYTEDLSYGRSEHEEGPTQVTVQRDGIPGVGMAFLEAYEATKDRFYLEAARDAAQALVKGQYCSGGWDYVIEFDPEKRKQYPYRVDGNCAAGTRRVTTLDDNTTQGALRLLMRVDRELGFQDRKIHEAALYALDQLSKAQYPNGAWPQRYNKFPDPKDYPVKRASYPPSWPRQWPGPNYQGHYTFNDNSICDMIDAMLEAARIYNEPKYRASAEKGGQFILLAQMPEPQPAWAQQYNADMHPVWARIFEPPSVTGGESQSIMRTLLVLYRETGDRKYLEPIPKALAYLRRSVLPPSDRPVEARDRIPKGTPVLARFYELQTNKPLYITKGTRVSVQNQSSTLVDGYQISYDDQSVITHYGVLTGGGQLDSLAADYEQIAKADPAKIRRPDRLHGLSPWSQQEDVVGAGGRRSRRGGVEAILAGLDARGAWVEQGDIGRSEQVVSVFAARDMTVTIGDRILPLKENETLRVFQGTERPRTRIIRSRTFADNVQALSNWLKRQRN